MIKKNSSDEIIETVHSPDIDIELIIEANLNSISLLESSELCSDISQLKVPIKNHTKIIEEDYLDLTEVPPTSDIL